MAAGKQRLRSFQPNHIGMLTHEFQDSPPLPDLRERVSEHAVVCLVKLIHLRRRWTLLFPNNKDSVNLDIPNNNRVIDKMVDISLGFTAIKETLGLLKTINDAKSDFEIRAATSEVQSKLLTLQSECFSLGDAIRSREEEIMHLKAKIAKFEDFESKVEGYVLNQLDSGTLVYTKSEAVHGKEIAVNLCPNCFSRHAISILQPLSIGESSVFHISRCLSCDQKLAMNKNVNYKPPKTMREIGEELNGGIW